MDISFVLKVTGHREYGLARQLPLRTLDTRRNSFILPTVDLCCIPMPSLCHTTTSTSTTSTTKSGQQFRDTRSFRCAANGDTICDGCATPGGLSTNVERKSIKPMMEEGALQATPHVVIIVFVKQAKLSHTSPSPLSVHPQGWNLLSCVLLHSAMSATNSLSVHTRHAHVTREKTARKATVCIS
ncbi:unnamed protein product [Ectocarpus sp. 12 AP-2014]